MNVLRCDITKDETRLGEAYAAPLHAHSHTLCLTHTLTQACTLARTHTDRLIEL